MAIESIGREKYMNIVDFCKQQKAPRTPCSSWSASCPDNPSFAFLSNRVMFHNPFSICVISVYKKKTPMFLFETLWLCRSCVKSISLFALSQNSDSSSEPPRKVSKMQGSLMALQPSLKLFRLKINKHLNNANKM